MRGDDWKFGESDAERGDIASEMDGSPRQSGGGPYRDRRDALVLQRRRLLAEIDGAERAVERAERARRSLEVLEPEIARESTVWLDAIRIETPCRTDWSAMRGNDATRRCDRCQREVHDLARMTRAEIAALFARADGAPCVRLRRRPDGRIATADCPSERPRGLASRAAGVLAGAALGASAAGGIAIALSTPTIGGSRSPRRELDGAAITEPRRLDGAAIAEPPLLAGVAIAEPRRSVHESPPVENGALRSAPEEETVLLGVPLAPALPITAADYDAHVRWIAPQVWEIDRELVDRALLETSSLRHRPRVIRDARQGRVIGVRIYGVRAGSGLARLGIENGDTLIDVNGYELASPDRALEAYSRLRTANALFVRIERGGEERIHVYRII